MKKKQAKKAGGSQTDMQQPIDPNVEAQAAEEALNADETQAPAQEAAEPPHKEEADKPTAPTEPTAEEKLQTALDAAVAQREEYLSLAQRVQADFDNFRRRNQSVRAEAFDDGARAFAATLLPVLDNLERAIAAAQDSPDASLKEGVEMVNRQLCDAFAKRGITPISRKGEKFDPNLENAVMQAPAEDGEPGTVCEVLQKGYQMGSSVLRHAMVKVVAE